MDIHKLLPYRSPPSIAVIGDICLDLYYFTGKDGAEISVETGLQSYSVFRTRQDAGGAGNTAVNCKCLGAKQVDLYGLTGNDCWGVILKNLLTGKGIGTDGVLVQEKDWQTHVYHKIYQGRDELPRYDMGNQNRPLDEKADELLALLESKLDTYQCVIINEQVPSGLHSQYFQEKLAALIENNRGKTIWFTDCRRLNDRYAHTIHKLNIHEAAEIMASNGITGRDENDPLFAAGWLYKRWAYPLVLTMGEEGALVHDESGCKTINSVHLTQEIDIVGAGDAFLAGLVTAYGAGIDLYEAAMTGAFSAGVSLGKLMETGHPTVEEVIAIAETGDFNYNSRMASDSRLARYLPGTEIEIVTPDIKPGPLKTAIFDHDGTISVLRQGWEEAMFDVMTEAIMGGNILSADEITTVQKTVSEVIEKTTGIQTLAQMYQLKDMVNTFGYVIKENILSPEEYKKKFSNTLQKRMEKRFDLLKKGKLKNEDMTIKGAIQFLQKLAASGVKLCLASGTDQDDVIHEAQILGYADLFNGGIKGSVGDIQNDPKKVVISSIIAGIKAEGGNPAEAVVFGDGPVEMREAKKAGLLAVGILSDERRRWGINSGKRKRLILGGADILIPDFSWADELINFCGWRLK